VGTGRGGAGSCHRRKNLERKYFIYLLFKPIVVLLTYYILIFP
jgi:hypothetical protein